MDTPGIRHCPSREKKTKALSILWPKYEIGRSWLLSVHELCLEKMTQVHKTLLTSRHEPTHHLNRKGATLHPLTSCMNLEEFVGGGGIQGVDHVGQHQGH